MAPGSLKNLAARVRNNPDLVEDAEIVRETKRPTIERVAEAAKAKLSKKSVFGAIKDFVKSSKDHATDGWQRQTTPSSQDSKTFKQEIREAVQDVREKYSRKNVMGKIGGKIAGAKAFRSGELLGA